MLIEGGIARPALQQKATELLPELFDLIENNAPASDASMHPAMQLIHNTFDQPQNVLMGALLGAYLTPYMTGKRLSTTDKDALTKVIAGEWQPTLDKKEVGKGKNGYPMPVFGAFARHEVLSDAFGKICGNQEEGKRLANAFAPLHLPTQIPLVVVGLNLSGHEVNAGLEKQMEQLREQGKNPLEKLSVLEVGGDHKADDFPIWKFMKYENRTTGGKYADPKNPDYLTLETQHIMFKDRKFDYAITSNVICPVVADSRQDLGAASVENANLFCTCANLTKAGGKMIHTNAYDARVNSPALYDRELHDLAGVSLSGDSQPRGVASPEKAWVYTKAGDTSVSTGAFHRWAEDLNIQERWNSALRAAIDADPRAGLTVSRLSVQPVGGGRY